MVVYLASGLVYLVVAWTNRVAGNSWLLTALVTVRVRCLDHRHQRRLPADSDRDGRRRVRRPRRRCVAWRRSSAGNGIGWGRCSCVVLGMVVVATGASFMAAASLSLITFVPFLGPFLGLAVLPLQLLAWILREIVFQYIGLSSVGAYLKLYRDFSARAEQARVAARPCAVAGSPSAVIGARMTDYEKYLSHTGRELHESAIRRMGTVVARAGDLVSFAPGYPDATMFPWAELHEIAAQLLTGSDGSTLQYGPTRGYQPLLDAIVGLLGRAWYSRRHRAVDRSRPDPSRASISPVASWSALGKSCWSNCRRSLEQLPPSRTCRRMWSASARSTTASTSTIWIACGSAKRTAGKTVKLLYLVPNFQNPTGVLISLEKRRAIVAWAEQRDVLDRRGRPVRLAVFRRRCDERGDASDAGRRSVGTGDLPEHLLKDPCPRPSRRLDGGARRIDRTLRYGETGRGPDVGNARSAAGLRGGAPRRRAIGWRRDCGPVTRRSVRSWKRRSGRHWAIASPGPSRRAASFSGRRCPTGYRDVALLDQLRSRTD